MTAIPTIVPVAATLRYLLATGEYAMTFDVKIVAEVTDVDKIDEDGKPIVIARQTNEWFGMGYPKLCFLEARYGKMYADMPEAALAEYQATHKGKSG